MSTRSQAIALTPSTAGFSSTFPEEASLTKNHSALSSRIISLYQGNIGLLYIIASQLSGTCMNVSVKLLNELDPPVPTFEVCTSGAILTKTSHLYQIIFIRMAITWLFAVSVMYYTRVPNPITGPPGVRILLAFRGFSGFFGTSYRRVACCLLTSETGLFGIYYSLVYLSLSDAIVITFLVPTTTAIAGYLLLNESLSRREIVAGALSFVGVVLIARPEFLFGDHSNNTMPTDGHEVPVGEKGTPTQRLVAVGVALLGVVGATGALTSIRAIGHRAHSLHSVSFFSMWSCFVSVTGMIILRVPIIMPQNFLFAVLMLGIGVFGFLTQVFLTMGLQRETASRGSLGLYVQILFAAIAERWIFHTTPSYLSLLGTIIIMACAIYVAVSIPYYWVILILISE
ncbi:hypothetical protein M408DRAFT_258013 [Serendipita vermifera MAFF 305830]|uniref:EamA domain-containing protein n=1 Tax=Serendipita vermifera MAFF 305830 TaxID=933852 RepID=A0A0C2XQX3_SERVB|nr:hypothetical protein M408DRAFT_258013 [Serendipita vermifera MAFF 305830]